MNCVRCPAIPTAPNPQCITKGHQLTYCTTTISGDTDYFFGTVIRVEQNGPNFTVDVKAGDCVQTLDSTHRPAYLVSVKGGETEVHDANPACAQSQSQMNKRRTYIPTHLQCRPLHELTPVTTPNEKVRKQEVSLFTYCFNVRVRRPERIRIRTVYTHSLKLYCYVRRPQALC